MSQQEYIWAWIAYLGGFVLFMSVVWYWTRPFWLAFKLPIRALLATLFLVPWYTDAGKDFMSPAWLVSLADVLLNGADAFWRAGLALVLALGVVFTLSVAYLVFRHVRSA